MTRVSDDPWVSRQRFQSLQSRPAAETLSSTSMSSPEEDLLQAKCVIKLYVLLDRIGRVDDFTCRGIDINEQKLNFKMLFDTLPKDSYKSLFQSDTILDGTISFDDRKVKPTSETLTSQDASTGRIAEPDPFYNDSILHCDPTPIKGETILQRAISLLPAKSSKLAETKKEEKSSTVESDNTDLEEIIDFLFEKVPFLVTHIRCGPEYEGQTPLHVAVMKENIAMVKKIVETINNSYPGIKESLLNHSASGLKFKNTPMLAGTPLCVAALTFNQQIFNYLINNYCKIYSVNGEFDNVFHSLIKYAYCCNHLIEKVLKMMDYIAHCQWISPPRDRNNPDHLDKEAHVLKLWMTYNRKAKTPLQLTVKLGLHEIFTRIMSYKVYCFKTDGDIGNDSTSWDITDIETTPQLCKPHNETPTSPVSPLTKEQDSTASTIHPLRELSKQYVILRAILKQKSPKTAYAFIKCSPVEAVIDGKWKSYRWIFLFMGLCHFAFMCLLSASGIMRSKMYNKPYDNPDEERTDPPRFIYPVAEAPTLIAMNIASGSFVLYGLIGVILSVKGISKCNFNYPYSWLLRQVANPYSNSIFKLFAYLMLLFLLADIVAAYTSETYEHQSLMFALIIGWYIELFFLQALKPLSFFAALIQKVVLDMIRFAFFIGILLVAFSAVMFMLMQGANTDDDAFDEFPQTILRMLNIMLGLGEIDALLQARHPAGAAIVFVLFVLLTTILLLNALIAMMSNTCTELMSDRGRILATDYHYNLQKLSVVVFMETVLPKRFFKIVGSVKNRFWFKHDKTVNQNEGNGQIQNGKWYVAERLIWKQESTIDVDNGGVYEADDTLVAEVSFKALKHLFKKESKRELS